MAYRGGDLRRCGRLDPDELESWHVRVVVDHLSGSRRGQRQEFATPEKVSFGRHPGCDVSFDAHRDLDASSRHAELEISGGKALLRDVGSSNGTFVGGSKVTEIAIDPRNAIVVEFGAGGPQIQLWVGDSAGDVPPTSVSFGIRRHRGRTLLIAALLGLVVVGVLVVQLLRS